MTAPLVPPTPRDFEILRLHHVVHLSTRAIADKHQISQTRVRQIVHRVCRWLAANLPVPTEADREAEARLAQHLAADQLQHQAEQMRTYFDATGDPKYLRQQTRVIASLARLGVVPGAIDSLAADQADDVPASPPAESPPPTTAPPLEACSPVAADPSAAPRAAASPASAIADVDDVCAAGDSEAASQLEELNLIERRLLAVLDSTDKSDFERYSSLQKNLASIRRQRDCLQLQLSPHHPGIALQSSGSLPIRGSGSVRAMPRVEAAVAEVAE